LPKEIGQGLDHKPLILEVASMGRIRGTAAANSANAGGFRQPEHDRDDLPSSRKLNLAKDLALQEAEWQLKRLRRQPS